MKKGWEIKRLPEIAEYFIGLTYSPKDVSDVGTIVLRSSNVQNDELDLSDLVRVTCSVKKPLHVRKGDILMCSRNGSKRLVGKMAVIGNLPEQMTFGTFMTVIRSDCNPYLSWFFRSEAFRDQIGVGENTMINQITKYMLDVIRVPVPPLAEQQRIVALLDEAFAGLATAKASAEQNLQNARALFESHLQSVFSQRGEGWVERRLGDILKTGAGGTPLKSKKEYYEGGTIPWLMSGEVSQGEVTVATKFITAMGLENSSARMFPPDTVLVAMYGATAGQVGILRFKAATNQAVCGILPSDRFIPEFLFYFLLSRKGELVAQATGNAQPNISQIKIKNIEVPLIPLIEQREIVAKFIGLSQETQRLTRLYERKLAALEELKTSLLHQAFNGEL